MDLALGSQGSPTPTPALSFWLIALGVILGAWGLLYLLGKVLSSRWKNRLATILGPLFVFALPSLIGLSGYDLQRQALSSLLELALILLATWICASTTRRWGLAPICFALTAGVALIEQAAGHPVIGLGPRIALQAALLCVVGLKLALALRADSLFELRASAALLLAPLLARLIAVASWTALLGVPVPEAYCPYTLAVWSLCALGLCATTFPRGKGPSVLTFALSSTLSMALAFLLYLHYLKRFGTIQATFDAITQPVLGVNFPYPQWQPTAVSSLFAVSTVFVAVLILRCMGQASTRRQGLALALWFCAGIGLHRSLDLMGLALAVDQLRATWKTPRPQAKT